MNEAFEIFYGDLTKEAQERLCEAFSTSEGEENWEVMPLSIIEREDDNESD